MMSLPDAILLRAVISSASGCVRTRSPNSRGVACRFSHFHEVAFQFRCRVSYVSIPPFCLSGDPDATKVLVTASIAEPPTHLQQGIVGAGSCEGSS